MKEKITPCLWFNAQAKEAAALYCSILPDTRVTSQSPIVTGILVSGQSITLLDGGPQYKPNPSISLVVVATSQEEQNKILAGLGKDAQKLEKDWIVDKFGIGWHVVVGELPASGNRIIPCLLFTGKLNGRAREARSFYTDVFKSNNEKFVVEDKNGFDFTFTEGVSLTVHCETQEEIDYYWERLTGNGGKESMCGWLKDKYGVSWQIIPVILTKIMSDPGKAGKAAQAFMSMRKLNIEQIVQASIS
jgi:predicted 3-demethylubiquinone-9 3-methyltransferase (glyoxalase superfamily)